MTNSTNNKKSAYFRLLLSNLGGYLSKQHLFLNKPNILYVVLNNINSRTVLLYEFKKIKLQRYDTKNTKMLK